MTQRITQPLTHSPSGRVWDGDLRDPIFKGATRPAMLCGVPLVWLLVVSGVALIIAPYLLYLLSPIALVVEALLYAPIYLWMRATTARDDQRLRQMAMAALMRIRQFRGRRLWGALSYAPLRYKRRSA